MAFLMKWNKIPETFYKQLELLRYSKEFFFYFSRPFWWENHAVCRPVALRPIPCLLFQQHLSQTWATRFHSVNQLQRIHVSDSEMHDSMYFFLVSNVIQGVVFLLFFWKETKRRWWLEWYQSFCFSRLTQVLEDFQKVLSANIDSEDEQTLEKISQDVSTLRQLWQKIRNNPTQALSGR